MFSSSRKVPGLFEPTPRCPTTARSEVVIHNKFWVLDNPALPANFETHCETNLEISGTSQSFTCDYPIPEKEDMVLASFYCGTNDSAVIVCKNDPYEAINYTLDGVVGMIEEGKHHPDSSIKVPTVILIITNPDMDLNGLFHQYGKYIHSAFFVSMNDIVDMRNKAEREKPGAGASISEDFQAILSKIITYSTAPDRYPAFINIMKDFDPKAAQLYPTAPSLAAAPSLSMRKP